MASVNKVILIGHLGKDPEFKSFTNGSSVANLSLATTESYTDKEGNKKEKTEWHNLVVWGKLAEVCDKYLKKGALIYVEGKIETQSYENNGEKKYFTKIIVNSLTMLGKKESNASPNASEANTELSSNQNDDLPF